MKIVRDILLILVLLGAILVTPLVVREFSSSDETASSKPRPAQEATHEQAPEAPAPQGTDGMPPQPKPAEAEPGGMADQVPDNAPEAIAPGDTAIKQLQEMDNPTPENQQKAEDAPMEAANCSGVDLGAQHNYDAFAENKKPRNSFVMATSPGAKLSIKGSGFDLYKDKAGGDLHMDGVSITGMGIYDIRNDAPNRLYLSARALTGINGRHAIVIGDKADQLYLDPCLEWNDPIAIEDGAEPMLRYDAHDAEGNPASISVTDGVQVVKPAGK
jgi:hypothetical protein